MKRTQRLIKNTLFSELLLCLIEDKLVMLRSIISLKEMLISWFIILIQVTAGIDVCALMVKKHISSLVLSIAAALYPPRSVLAPVCLSPTSKNIQSALIGQLAHTWPSTTNNNRAAVLFQSIFMSQTSCKEGIMQISDMVT